MMFLFSTTVNKSHGFCGRVFAGILATIAAERHMVPLKGYLCTLAADNGTCFKRDAWPIIVDIAAG